METVASPSAEEDYPQSSIVPRACNACRARKIGCNRDLPCAHCVRAKIECTYSDARRPREKRARILLSHQYEQKIDQLDSRLDEIITLLKDLKSHQESPSSSTTTTTITTTLPPIIHVQPPKDGISPTITSSSTSSTKIPSSSTSSIPSPASCHVPSADATRDAKSPMVEGDSSLTAQSVFANDFLQRVLNRESRPEMREGLDALHVIVEAMKRQPAAHEMTYPHAAPVTSFAAAKCELPPIEKTAHVLKIAQSKEMLALAWVYEFLPVRMFQETCFRLYMSDEYDLINVVTVNTVLHFLFWACSHLNPETKDEYYKLACQCGTNVEIALANLPLHLPATDEAITALLLGSFYAVEISKPSLSWILCSKASELIQTLGYHRKATFQYMTAENCRFKQYLFWGMYIVDKSLSLRLGRSSTIQDFDITVPFPKHDDPGATGLTSCFVLWCMCAKVQGQIYELLYSPEAMVQSEEVRRSRMQLLATRLAEVENKTAELQAMWQEYSSAAVGEDLLKFFQISDHVLRLSILTLTYRAVPNPVGSPTTFSMECIQAARQTLARHEECMAVVERSDCGLFSTYMHWTILMAPFVPFIVLFCQVIETRDTEDLARLKGFAASLQFEASVTEAVDKLRRLFQVLYSVASRYVESQTGAGSVCSSVRAGGSRVQQIQPSQQEVDAYLATLGFPQAHINQGAIYDQQQQLGAAIHAGPNAMSAEELQRGINPMMWMGNGAQLEDWFYSNQQMMALLEDGFMDTGLGPI